MTDLVAIDTAAALSEAAAFLELVKDTIAGDVQLAAEVASEAKTKKEFFDEKRKYLKAPTLEAGRRVDETFMPIVKVYAEVEKLAKKVIDDGLEAASQQKHAALSVAGTIEEVKEAQAIDTRPPDGVGIRSKMRVRVHDWRKVPERFLLLNEAAVLREYNENGQLCPGLMIHFDRIVEVRKP